MNIDYNYNYRVSTYSFFISGSLITIGGIAISILGVCTANPAALFASFAGLGTGLPLCAKGMHQVLQDRDRNNDQRALKLKEAESVFKRQSETTVQEISSLSAKKDALTQEIRDLAANRDAICHRGHLFPTTSPAVTSDGMCLEIAQHHATLLAEAPQSGDATLITKDHKSFKVHSFLLKPHPYLNLYERDELNEVHLPLNEKETKAFLQFLYTGRLDPLTLEEGCNLFMVASLCLMNDLQKVVKSRLSYLFNQNVENAYLAYSYISQVGMSHPELEEFILLHWCLLNVPPYCKIANTPISQEFYKDVVKGQAMYHKVALVGCSEQSVAHRNFVLTEGIKANYLPALILAVIWNTMDLLDGKPLLDTLQTRLENPREEDDPLVRGWGYYVLGRKRFYDEAYFDKARALNCVLAFHPWTPGACLYNAKKARQLVTEGMQLGNLQCQTSLGGYLENGSGGRQSMKEAFVLYKDAALKGWGRAQRYLAMVYANPEEYEHVVVKNLETARFWCQKSIENGDEEAGKLLARLVD